MLEVKKSFGNLKIDSGRFKDCLTLRFREIYGEILVVKGNKWRWRLTNKLEIKTFCRIWSRFCWKMKQNFLIYWSSLLRFEPNLQQFSQTTEQVANLQYHTNQLYKSELEERSDFSRDLSSNLVILFQFEFFHWFIILVSFEFQKLFISYFA